MLYRRMRSINPSPYMFFMRLPEVTLFGSSPELMVRCTDGKLQLSPIAGTRRRGRDDEEDAALAADLLASAKDRAENLMLVDLMRNDLARAAAEYGVSYVVVTGVPLAGDQLGNVLASPQAELHSQSFERIDAGFLGAGDILSAALAALLATGSDLTEAVGEALLYLDQALDHGFRPGMGRAVADRLFWASAEADDDGADDAASPDPLIDIPHPFNETKH